MQTPQNKPKKYPPRALAKMATMDGDIPKEKLERKKTIEVLLNSAQKTNGDGKLPRKISLTWNP